MGKKKVAEQTTEQALKATEAVESAMAKMAKGLSRKYEQGNIYVKASYNNTIITVTNDKGGVVAWASAGSLGFSGPKKATPFAASKVVGALTEKLKKSGPFNVHVFINGIGGGRDSSVRSLINQGFNVLSIKDITPIPHNGVRPPKVRRV